MAPRRTPRRAVAEEPQYTCGDCANSYDYHERGWDGKPFLCRCPFYKEGKFCRFLNEPRCKEHFILKNHATSD